MQESKVYAGKPAPVKCVATGSATGSATGTARGQRMECRIVTRQGTLHLAGTVAEVMGFLRAQCCQCGKMIELLEVRG